MSAIQGVQIKHPVPCFLQNSPLCILLRFFLSTQIATAQEAELSSLQSSVNAALVWSSAIAVEPHIGHKSSFPVLKVTSPHLCQFAKGGMSDFF